MNNKECKLAVNHEKLAECGFSFENWSDMYLYMSSLVDFLESHNKNYTKEQYSRICTLKEILESIEQEIQI